MDKLKRVIFQLPEFLLIAAAIFYWISEGVLFNPISIAFIVILALQIILRNRISGIVIGSGLLLISFYMLFALLSEFKEFPTFNSDAKNLLFTGLSLFGLSVLISIIMLIRYATMEKSK